MIKLFCIQQQGKTISSVLQSYFPLPHIRGKMLVFFWFLFPYSKTWSDSPARTANHFFEWRTFLVRDNSPFTVFPQLSPKSVVIMDEVRAMFLSLTQVLILHFRCQIKLPISLAFLAGDARNQRANPEILFRGFMERKLDQSTWNVIYFSPLTFLWVGTAFTFKQHLLALCTSSKLESSCACYIALLHVFSSPCLKYVSPAMMILAISILLASISKALSETCSWESRIWKGGRCRTFCAF